MNPGTDTANRKPRRAPIGERGARLADNAGFAFVLVMLLSGWFSIAISQIALGLALAALLVRWIGAGRAPVRTGLEKPALALLVWAALMIPLSSAPAQSLLYFRRFYLLAAIWVAASCAPTERRRVLLGAALLLGALIVSMHAQFAPLPAGRGLFAARLTGPFNAMTTGALLMIAALAAFGFVLAGGTGRLPRWLIALAALSLTVGVLQTQTRSAILGLGVGAAGMFLVTRPRTFGVLVLVVLAGGLLLRGPLREALPDRLEQRFSPSQLFAGNSPQARLEMWRGGWRMVSANPVTGVGDRGIEEIAPEYYGDEDTTYYGHLHSNPVQLAVIWGAPGFLLGSWFLLAPGWLLLKRWRPLWRSRRSADWPRTGAAWTVGALGAWAGFNIAGLTEWYFGDAETMLIYLAVLGCALGAAPGAGTPVPNAGTTTTKDGHG